MLALLSACSSDDSSGLSNPSATGCTPGQTVACACPGSAVTGAQTCLSNGTFDACSGCPDASGGSSQGGQGGSLSGGKGGTSGQGGASAGGAGQGGASAGTAGSGTSGEAGSSGASGQAGAGIGGASGQGGSGVSGQAGSGGNASGAGGSGGSGAGAGGAGGGAGGAGGTGAGGEPATCAEAVAQRSNLGCDYWPTVTANVVWSIFDYAVIVANPGKVAAKIQVTRGAQVIGSATIQPGVQERVFLPWIPELKGPDANSCGEPVFLSSTVRQGDGAYHLTSDRPIAVYQFNALEAKGVGGLPGKSWAGCPGDTTCASTLQPLGCFSFSNDASLLLPTSTLTSSYRVVSPRSLNSANFTGTGSYIVVTGTQNGTTVKVTLPQTGATLAGGGLPAATAGQQVSFSMAAGEVIQLLGAPTSELSGALVQADKPVQVLSGTPCANVPNVETASCDHQEESMPPAESLGKHYLIAPPTGPNGDLPGHAVRLVGHVGGTQLTYKGQPPAGAPTSLEEGQMVDLGLVKGAFEVEGNKPFLVGIFLPGATILDPLTQVNAKGDPALSIATSVEQFRKRYAFLTPGDYDVTYVDVTAQDGTTMTLDGAPVPGNSTLIDGTTFRVFRLLIDNTKTNAHVLEANQPVGVQVMGYAPYASYQYPAGANYSVLP